MRQRPHRHQVAHRGAGIKAEGEVDADAAVEVEAEAAAVTRVRCVNKEASSKGTHRR